MTEKTLVGFYLITWGKLLESDFLARTFAQEVRKNLGFTNKMILEGFEKLVDEGVSMSEELIRLKKVIGG